MAYAEKVDIYASESAFRKDLFKLEERINLNSKDRSPEPFIKSFRNTYIDKYPPIWMATEVMSLGLLSKWYRNLRASELRKRIAEPLDLQATVLESFLQVFTIYRNAAAHHSRVWNRPIAVELKRFRTLPESLSDALNVGEPYAQDRIYGVLAIASYITKQTDPNSTVVSDLKDVLLAGNEEWLGEMDVPLGFEDLTLWSSPSQF